MRNSILIACILASALACQPQQEQNKEIGAVEAAVPPDSAWQSYGSHVNKDVLVAATDLPAMADGQDSLFITVKGKAVSSCSKKGCWMKVAVAEGEEMRVTFKDYAFFVPKDLSGEEVVFQGVLTRKVNDVKTLRHYAQDAGASQEEIASINAPEEEYSFEAIGVLVKR